MSITNELREAITWFVDSQRDRFSAIADRIDEQCERELTMARGEAVQHLGSEVAKKYVKLPVDADGEPIHLGDVMDNTHKDGFRAKRVTGICYHEGGKTTVEVDEDRLRWHNAHKLHHVKPDSWERIIEDAQTDGIRYHNEGKPSDFDALVERCKRLAGEVE